MEEEKWKLLEWRCLVVQDHQLVSRRTGMAGCENGFASSWGRRAGHEVAEKLFYGENSVFQMCFCFPLEQNQNLSWGLCAVLP